MMLLLQNRKTQNLPNGLLSEKLLPTLQIHEILVASRDPLKTY